MIDRALGFTSPDRKNAYYFQFYPNKIKLKRGQKLPSQPFFIKLGVFKGAQAFHKTRLPIQLNFSRTTDVLAFKKIQSIFYIPDFNESRKSEFIVKLFIVQGEQQQAQSGSFPIDAKELVDLYQKQDKSNVRKSEQIGPFIIQFDLFTERTRYNLEKIVKQFKEQEKETQGTEISRQRRNQSQASDKPQSRRFDRRKNEETTSNKFIKLRESKQEKVKTATKPLHRFEREQKMGDNQSQTSEKKSQKSSSKGGYFLSNPNEQISSPKPALSGIDSVAYKKKLAPSMKTSSIKIKSSQKDKKQPTTSYYNIKMIIFLLFSAFLMYEAMTPTRRAPYKRSH